MPPVVYWLVATPVAALFCSLASAPMDFFPALWIGMGALAYLLDEPIDTPRARGRMGGGARGLMFGLVVNLVAIRFVPSVIARFTPLPWVAGVLALVLLAAAQGLRWMMAAIVRHHLARRGVPTWAAFAVGMYVGTFVPAVFPWTPAGSQSPWPVMVQLADLIGERGVTVLVAASAGLLASAVRAGVRDRHWRRASTLATIAVAIPLLTALHGRWRMGQIDTLRARARTAKIALLQPGTGALERWDRQNRRPILDRLTALTRSAEQRGAELTVWPEASYPVPVGHVTRRCPLGEWAMLPFGVRGPVLTGLVTARMTGDEIYNSAAVCSTDGSLSEPYDKMHLLWFGEAVPFADQIPWLRTTFSHGAGMLPGDHSVVQVAGPVRAGILNCFEDLLPLAGREAMVDRPNLLVNLTNDAWFHGSIESEMHFRVSVLRAIEQRRDLVRAVNLGPTAWVDAAGRVRARYSEDLPGALLTEPALLETPTTPYGRWGDAPTALALTVAMGVWLWRERRAKRVA